jgi:glycerol-3-phosphate dehydrogenase
VILEGLNAIEMFHNLADEKLNKDLPIFNKLYRFLSDKETELNFEFSELGD